MALFGYLNVGTNPDDNTGDTARAGGQKINTNFKLLDQQILTDATNIAFNVSLGYKGTLTLTANRNILAATNVSDGQLLVLVVKTDGSSRTLTFSSEYKDTDGTTNMGAKTIPASGIKIYQFIQDAGTFYRF
jgi:hypothetical protein